MIARISATVLLFAAFVRGPLFAQSSHSIKCGTPLVLESIKSKRPLFKLPEGWRDSLRSPSGRFLIHFDASDPDTNNITTTAFANLTALEADSAYDFEVTALGYPEPAFTVNGHYDIYLVPKPYNSYGATFPLDGGDLGMSAAGIPRTRSYIEMDNRFTDVIYATKGYDALRITTFHEFFHLIQFADYGHNQTYSYFQEMSSVWMEMISSPGIPDFLNSVGDYLDHLELSFDATQNGGYGMGIYLYYLQNRFGRDIVQEIWRRYSGEMGEPIAAIDSTLHFHGSDFCAEYKLFGTNLYYSGLNFRGHSLLPYPQLLPREKIVVHRLRLDQKDTIVALPASLTFIESATSADSCDLIVARNADRSLVGTGVVSITGEGSYTANYDQPTLFCDTIVCAAAPSVAGITVFPMPFVISSSARDVCYIRASTKAAKPVSTILNIYNLNMEGVFHSETTAVPFNGTWNALWDGSDGGGRAVESGVYLYDLIADGVESEGKIVVVRK